MLAKHIKVGGLYLAKVSGRLTTVRVTAIRSCAFDGRTVYDVTNLRTKRTTTFRSAQKFRTAVAVIPKGTLKGAERKYLEDAQVPFIETEGEQRSDPTLKDTTTVLGTTAPESVSNAETSTPTLDLAAVHPPTTTAVASPATGTATSAFSQLTTSGTGRMSGEPAGVQTAIQANQPATATPATEASTTAAPQYVLSTESGTATMSRLADIAKTPESLPNPPADTSTAAPAPGLASGFASSIAATPTVHSGPAVTFTDEQQAILEAAPNEQVLVIEAGAGCGKTFELKELTNILPGMGQYTAFNAPLVAESKEKFPRHVPCNTIHSLAFRAEGHKHSHRLRNKRRVMSGELAAMMGIRDEVTEGADGKPKRLKAAVLAAFVKQAVSKFTSSADREISLKHMPRITGLDELGSTAHSDRLRDKLLPFARRLWADKCNPGGTLPFVHDDYVKMWEMNSPVIGTDYVLLDEAQDTSPVMLSVMEQQVRRGTRVILVGDSAQQIYSWRGAVNALAAFPDAKRLYLSQSFRFGPVIAEVANAVLSHLEERTQLVMKGTERIGSRLDAVAVPRAVLCRTNAGAVGTLLEGLEQGRRGHMIGGGDDVAAFVRAAGELQGGRTTTHPELCCFETWKEVQVYAKEDEGEDLRLMVKLVDQFKVAPLLRAISSMPAEKDADFVVGTGHRSKGREWKTVQLAGDWKPLDRMGDEEVRLLYVAATRAQGTLDIERCPPFCGGMKEREDGSSSRLPTIDVSKARRMSQAVVSPAQAPLEEEQTSPRPSGVEQYGSEHGNAHGSSAAPVAVNTWAKGDKGKWLVRGVPGQSGTIEVHKRNGSKSRETIRKVVWTGEDAALYDVSK